MKFLPTGCMQSHLPLFAKIVFLPFLVATLNLCVQCIYLRNNVSKSDFDKIFGIQGICIVIWHSFKKAFSRKTVQDCNFGKIINTHFDSLF